MTQMTCPLCGTRRARRSCPALGKPICAVCCGTKRLVEIACPASCPYLASAREHPPAVAVRQQQRDVGRLLHHMRDFDELQSQLFFVLGSFLHSYDPPDFQPIADEEVAEAAAALANTLETAARGVIYEHRPASLPASRLATALKAVLAEAGAPGGPSFDRAAAVVLRRIEEGARAGSGDASDRRPFLALLARVLQRGEAGSAEPGARGESDQPRLIVP
jgi:hypothetical protein